MAIVHYGPVHDRTNQCLSNLEMHTQHKVRMWHQKGALVDRGRNAAQDHLRKIRYEWLLFCDDDTIFPDGVQLAGPSGLDLLLRHGHPIVSGLSVRRKPPCLPVIYNWNDRKDPTKGVRVITDGLDEKKLIRCDATGAAFLLIHREVFEKIEAMGKTTMIRPHGGLELVWQEKPFDHLPECGEDHAFFWRAMEAGFPIYCDTSFDIGHVGEKVYTIGDWLAYKEVAEELDREEKEKKEAS